MGCRGAPHAGSAAASPKAHLIIIASPQQKKENQQKMNSKLDGDGTAEPMRLYGRETSQIGMETDLKLSTAPSPAIKVPH